MEKEGDNEDGKGNLACQLEHDPGGQHVVPNVLSLSAGLMHGHVRRIHVCPVRPVRYMRMVVRPSLHEEVNDVHRQRGLARMNLKEGEQDVRVEIECKVNE